MDLDFATDKLRRTCEQQALAMARWGPTHAPLVLRRLAELHAFSCLHDVWTHPALRLRALSGVAQGQYAVDARRPLRVRFVPDTRTRPIGDGLVDPRQVTALCILAIEEGHDG